MSKVDFGKKTRFKKGQSGNPKGRPPKKFPFAPSAYDALLDKTLILTKNGIPREVTLEEANWVKEYNLAMAGDPIAIREVYKKIARHEQKTQKPDMQSLPALFDYTDPENAFEALRLLDIAVPDMRCDDYGEGRRLLLNNWGVDLALARRGLGILDANTIQNVKNRTVEPSLLVWPPRLKQ